MRIEFSKMLQKGRLILTRVSEYDYQIQFHTSILNSTAQLWRFNGRTLLNRQETYLHINGNSRLGIGKTKEGTPVTLERTGSKVSEIMAHHSSSWKRSRPITAQGNTNQWFTLYNVASKRYLTATGPRTMAIKGQLYQSVSKLKPRPF